MIDRVLLYLDYYKNKKYLWLILVFIAFLIRLLISQLGYNFDIASWNIVGEIIYNGGIVYTETYRYTTGPVWCYILGALYYIHQILNLESINSYHLLITAFLSLFDILTALFIWRKYKFSYSILFLFNPISILITSYHAQFDNIAVFIAFISWIILKNKKSDKNYLISSILIGISLLVKHIFVFYPIWIFFISKELNLKKRIIYFLIPYVIFFLGFLPFLIDPIIRENVIGHVFKYASQSGSGFIGIFGNTLPDFILNYILGWIPFFSGFKFFFLILMLLTGFYASKFRPDEIFFLYIISMLAFSTSIADQYLIIPCIACVYYYNKFEIKAYIITSSIYLIFISFYNISNWLYPIIFNRDMSYLYMNYYNFNSYISITYENLIFFINQQVDTLDIHKSVNSNSGIILFLKAILNYLRIYFLPLCQLWLIIFIIKFVFIKKFRKI